MNCTSAAAFSPGSSPLIHQSAAYAGTALAFRDRLVIEWNKTQQNQTYADQKRVYCGFRAKTNVAPS